MYEKMHDIILKVKEGDKDAFSELYRLYYPKIFSFLLRLMKSRNVAEEITQEVFFRLWINHEVLNPEMSHDSYFFSIAKNIAINNIRKAEIEKRYYDETLQQSVEETDPEEGMNFSELQELIDQAVDAMPPQQRLVFRLSREDGLINEKIAQKLNLSKRTVEKHISNSLKMLRKLIEKNYLLLFLP